MRRICVFCGSSFGNNPVYSKAVIELSKVLINNNTTLIYGGAKVGLMGVLADEILRSGGKIIGIIPRFLKDLELAHSGLTKLIEVETMHERKELMEKKSDGFIALPGGFGTIEEIFEMISWGQLRIHEKPCAFLNINGFYDLLDDFLGNMVKEGFVEKELKDSIIVESDPVVLMQKILYYVPHKIEKAKNALKKSYKQY